MTRIAVIIGKEYFPAAYRTGYALFYAIYESLKELGIDAVFGESLHLINDSMDAAIILIQSFPVQEVQQHRMRTKSVLIGLNYDPMPQGEMGKYIETGIRSFYVQLQAYIPFLDGLLDCNVGNVLFLKHCGYKVVHLKLGYHASFESASLEKDIDVVFLGILSAPRRRMFRPLKRLKHRKVYLTEDVNIIRNFTKFKECVGRSRIMLNVHLRRGLPFFTSMRIVMFGFTNRSLILTQECEYMENYENGKHIVFCHDGPDFYNQIEYYLNDEDAREKIVNNAYQIVKACSLRDNLQLALRQFNIRI